MDQPTEQFVVCWKHRETGEEGHGQPVARELAEDYMNRNPATLPEFEFSIRPALPEELGPHTKAPTKVLSPTA